MELMLMMDPRPAAFIAGATAWIMGQSPDAIALAKRLAALGAVVHSLPSGENIQATIDAVDALAKKTPVGTQAQLFLVKK